MATLLACIDYAAFDVELNSQISFGDRILNNGLSTNSI